MSSKTMTRADYVRVIEKKYFGSVMKHDYQKVIDNFTDDARVTIFHGDNPLQVFYKNPKRGKQSFKVFYGHLFDNYIVDFGKYNTVVDVAKKKAAATFTPHLKPKKGSAYRKTGDLHLNNCNFFWFRGDKIEDMIIYYANPTLGKKLGLDPKMPTAFPK